jgi:hypothetical protein
MKYFKLLIIPFLLLVGMIGVQAVCLQLNSSQVQTINIDSLFCNGTINNATINLNKTDGLFQCNLTTLINSTIDINQSNTTLWNCNLTNTNINVNKNLSIIFNNTFSKYNDTYHGNYAIALNKGSSLIQNNLFLDNTLVDTYSLIGFTLSNLEDNNIIINNIFKNFSRDAIELIGTNNNFIINNTFNSTYSINPVSAIYISTNPFYKANNNTIQYNKFFGGYDISAISGGDYSVNNSYLNNSGNSCTFDINGNYNYFIGNNISSLYYYGNNGYFSYNNFIGTNTITGSNNYIFNNSMNQSRTIISSGINNTIIYNKLYSIGGLYDYISLSSNNSLIYGNNFTGDYGASAIASFGNNNTIQNNYLKVNLYFDDYGIKSYGNYGYIFNNTIIGNQNYYDISIGANNYVINNFLDGCGLQLTNNANNISIYDNTFNYSTTGCANDNTGIDGGSNNNNISIYNNKFNNFVNGIRFGNTNNNFIYNNTFSGIIDYALYLSNDINTSIINNKVSSGLIYLVSTNPYISNNNRSGGSNYIMEGYTTNGYYVNNTFTNGMLYLGGNNNYFENNKFSSCNFIGGENFCLHIGSSFNTLYNNSFATTPSTFAINDTQNNNTLIITNNNNILVYNRTKITLLSSNNILVGNDLVAINSSAEVNLNKTATIILSNLTQYNYQPVVLYYPEFTSNVSLIKANGTQCNPPQCVNLSWNNVTKELTFTATSWSSYSTINASVPSNFNIETRDEVTNQIILGDGYMTDLTPTVTTVFTTNTGSFGIPTLTQELHRFDFRVDPNYPTRSYFYTINSTSGNYTVYLANGSTGQNVKFNVRSSAGTSIENAFVLVTKFISTAYVTVQHENTGIVGFVNTFLNPTVVYRISISANGYQTRTFDLEPTETEYTVVLTQTSTINYTNFLTGITFFTTPDRGTLKGNDTQQFSFTTIAPNGTIEYFAIFSNFSGNYYVNNVTTSPAGGTVNITINTTGKGGQTVQVHYIIKSNGFPDVMNLVKSFYLTDVTPSNQSLISVASKYKTEVGTNWTGIIAIFGSVVMGITFLPFTGSIGAGFIAIMSLIGFAFMGWIGTGTVLMSLILVIGTYLMTGGRD